MSERKGKLKSVGRSASTDSTEYSITMGKSFREKRKKPKERWLLTRKTWRYMADAGRKLIPDGASNRPEDIPKIEAYFQEVCRKEPKFLLWRKNSYPGAIGFRKKKKNVRKNSRSAASADEAETTTKPERPKDLAILNVSGGRFDLKKMRQDFLTSPTTPSPTLPFIPEQKVVDETNGNDEKLLNMLETILTLNEDEEKLKTQQVTSKANFDYEDLVRKLQHHLVSTGRYPSSSSSHLPYRPDAVHFHGDHVEKSLTETLSRYFGHSTNRDKVISDLLTNRKALEKLYFELRKTKGFRGRVTTGSPQLDLRRRNEPTKERERKIGTSVAPPVIEIVQATLEQQFTDFATQTTPIPDSVLSICEEEYKKELAARKEEEDRASNAPPTKNSSTRRRSSVDNDDVSQSVSDTIKRYLRMARKKSIDSDKADRFKRVNYDRNLRNIKPKGEITKPGDDDGLNKGCQTNDDWILTYRELGFVETASSDEKSPPHTKTHHSFLSHFLPGKHHDKNDNKHVSAASSTPSGSAMQKSKSSSSVMHQGSKLMAKKIFRTRSKSQTRAAVQPQCNWTPQGGCVWMNNISERQVVLGDTNLFQLSEVERKVLQKVAIAKLQALNLGVTLKVPPDSVTAIAPKKRRPYLLKRKAITTSLFDANRKDGEKDGNASGGLVFGIPLTQCMENDRISRAAAATTAASATAAGRRGSRASFTSLIDTHRGGEGSSSESLMAQERMAGSVPGLLDKISCGSTADIPNGPDKELTIPHILHACINHIRTNGIRTLGIFRVSTSKKRIRELRENFDSGREISLDPDQCPHDVATLLKEYLRDLPDPLLCRDLYSAFVQTQRIRNRRLQLEALQHLVQLLPVANRDTLHALLKFLADVAQNSDDTTTEFGEILLGNKMDSNNLATVFAPNILHCIKANSSKDPSTQDRIEDRIDVIGVVRNLIDHYHDFYKVSAELLDEIYVHMMDTHPDVLDELLTKRDAEESQEEPDSESYSAPWSPTFSIDTMDDQLPITPTEKKKMWSREECLHEAAATGGPNVGMRIRHKDKIRERSQRRKRDESATRKRSSDDSGTGSGGGFINIISRLRGQRDEDYQFGKNRSSSLESSSSAHTETEIRRMHHNVPEGITTERRKSSPYVMDNTGVITASLTIPVHQGMGYYDDDDDIPYIEDGDNGKQQLTIGVLKPAPAIPARRRQRSMSGSDSSVGSIQPITGCISLVHSDSAVGSSMTTQNTPTSVSDFGVLSSPPSWASTPPTSPDSVHTSVNYIPDDNHSHGTGKTTKEPKVTFIPIVREIPKSDPRESKEPRYTPSITSIGNAVLRSKTADFEKISKTETKPKTATSTEKKKYTKRRYTDSRHPTTHIPDSETLEYQTQKEETATQTAHTQAQPVYKRRELISSARTK